MGGKVGCKGRDEAVGTEGRGEERRKERMSEWMLVSARRNCCSLRARSYCTLNLCDSTHVFPRVVKRRRRV